MLDCTEVENGKPYLVNVKLQTEFKWENKFLDIFCSLNSDHKFRSNDWETNLQCGFSSFPNINADFSEEVNSAFETFLKEYSYFSSQKLYHWATDQRHLTNPPNSIISFGYVDSQAKIFLILYPSLDNSTTSIATANHIHTNITTM